MNENKVETSEWVAIVVMALVLLVSVTIGFSAVIDRGDAGKATGRGETGKAIDYTRKWWDTTEPGSSVSVERRVDPLVWELWNTYGDYTGYWSNKVEMYREGGMTTEEIRHHIPRTNPERMPRRQ